MTEKRKVDNDNIGLRNALFVNLRPLYVTDMRYLQECSGSECRVECVVLFIVQW